MQCGCILRSEQDTFWLATIGKCIAAECCLCTVSVREREGNCDSERDEWTQKSSEKRKLAYRHIIDVPYINHEHSYAPKTYVFIVVVHHHLYSFESISYVLLMTSLHKHLSSIAAIKYLVELNCYDYEHIRLILNFN